MFHHLRFLRERIRKRRQRAEPELTLETSSLTLDQIATAQKALKILGLEARLHELSKQDFIIFLYAMGLNPTDDIIDGKIRAFQLHHNRTYTFGQLAHVWHSMLQDLTDEDEILKRAFQFFDKDGNGEISVQELKTTMHELGDLLTEEEITSFMEIMDVNNDGAIGYTEFLATLKTQAPDARSAADKPLLAASSEGPLSVIGAPSPDDPEGGYDAPPHSLPGSPRQDPTLDQPGFIPSPFAVHSLAAAANAGSGPFDRGIRSREASSSGLPANSVPSGMRTASGSGVMRRQTSLKAGLPPPPVLTAAELLFNPDAPPTLRRPPSGRMGQHPPPVPSGAPQALLERSGSQRSRSNDLPAAGSGSAAGLRAPSALEPGPPSGGSCEGAEARSERPLSGQ